MCHYRNSYLKFPVMSSFVADFDKRAITDVQTTISRQMRRAFLQCGIDANLRDVYMLGFYDYLVREYGSELANNIIISHRNREYTQKLYKSAAYYGVKSKKPGHIKTALSRFAR